MPRSCAALIRLSVIHAQSQTPPSCGRQLDGAAVRTGDLRAHRPVQPEKVTAALDDANGPLDRLKIAGPDRGPVYAEEQPLQAFLMSLRSSSVLSSRAVPRSERALDTSLQASSIRRPSVRGASPLRYASMPNPCG